MAGTKTLKNGKKCVPKGVCHHFQEEDGMWREINFIGFISICILFGLYFLLFLYRLNIAKMSRNLKSRSVNRRKHYVDMILKKVKISVLEYDEQQQYEIAKKYLKNRVHLYRIFSLVIIFLISIIYMFSFYEENKVYYRGPDDAKLYQTRLRNIESIARIEAEGKTRYNAREGKTILADIKKIKKELKENFTNFGLQDEFTVIIDPGHGGKDPGAVYRGEYEKDIVYKVAVDLKRELEKKGIKAVFTREGDFEINNSERLKKAIKMRKFLFVSLHLNIWKDKDTRGFDVFYYSGKKGEYHYKESQNLGEIVFGELSRQKLVPGRKVRDANFLVIKYMNAIGPAILIEMGFMSNNYDFEVFIQKENRSKFVKKLADGIALYVKSSEQNKKKSD